MWKKLYRKYAPKASPKPIFNFGKWPKTSIACKEFFYKSNIWIEDYLKVWKWSAFFLSDDMSPVCHSYVIRMSLMCSHMLSLCHSYVVYVIRMWLVCTRMSMSSVCHSYVLVCHSYVPRPSSVVLPWALLIDRIELKCLFYCSNPVNGCFWSFNSHKYHHIWFKRDRAF